jgi:8-oxo-dGTP pyrophosphatase MutT (NUDIX family)
MHDAHDYADEILARLRRRYHDTATVEGILTEADDPEMAQHAAFLAQPGKWLSAGGVVMDKKDGVWGCYVAAPKGGYGGYKWVLPKGRVDEGETPEQAALREVFEELGGVRAKIFRGTKLGSFQGTMSVTIYYLMMHVSGVPKVNDEIAKIDWLPLDKAQALFASTGNKRDASVVAKAIPKVATWA